jgi:hypothetical protein
MSVPEIDTFGDRPKPKVKVDPNLFPVDRFGAYPGYWTEECLLNNWPPGWAPQEETRW